MKHLTVVILNNASDFGLTGYIRLCGNGQSD